MQINILEVGLNSLSPNIFNLASDLKQNSIYVSGINKEKSLTDAVKKIEDSVGYYALYLTENDYLKFTKSFQAGNGGEYIVNKISFSLAFNGMSTISANKAIEQILY